MVKTSSRHLSGLVTAGKEGFLVELIELSVIVDEIIATIPTLHLLLVHFLGLQFIDKRLNLSCTIIRTILTTLAVVFTPFCAGTDKFLI